MATLLKNLSETNLKKSNLFKKVKIGIVVSEWNPEITHSLMNAAISFLIENGVKEKHIEVKFVPGSFELPLGAQWLVVKNHDAVIALGCVIQGETKHFDFICQACANGIMQVGLQSQKPVIFGVLTTLNQKQAQERAGGKHGNKGIEAAETALKMLELKSTI